MSVEVTVSDLVESRPSAAVVDVRSEAEFAEGHIPGAVCIPLPQLAARVGEVPAGRVFVVCASGNRSKAATGLLRSAGVDAWSVAGGTQAWQDAGKALSAS